MSQNVFPEVSIPDTMNSAISGYGQLHRRQTIRCKLASSFSRGHLNVSGWNPVAAFAAARRSRQPNVAVLCLPKEVLFERKFHSVSLGTGDQNPVAPWR